MKSKVFTTFLLFFISLATHASDKIEFSIKDRSLNDFYATINENKKLNFFSYNVESSKITLGSQNRNAHDAIEDYSFSIAGRKMDEVQTFFILEKNDKKIKSQTIEITDAAIQEAKTITKIIYLPKDQKLVSFDFKITNDQKSLPLIKTRKINKNDIAEYYSLMRVNPATNAWNGKLNVLIIETFN